MLFLVALLFCYIQADVIMPYNSKPYVAANCPTTASAILYVSLYTFSFDSFLTAFQYTPCGQSSSMTAYFVIYDRVSNMLLFNASFTPQSGSNGNTIPVVVDVSSSNYTILAGSYNVGLLLSSSFFASDVILPSYNSLYVYQSFSQVPSILPRSKMSTWNYFEALGVIVTEISACGMMNCSTCTMSSNCTWCLDSSMCIKQTDPCDDRTNNPKRCGCSSQNTCTGCLGISKNCTWCENPSGDACITSSTRNCQTIIVNPKFCDMRKKK